VDEKVGGMEGNSNNYTFSCPIVGLGENAWFCCLSIHTTYCTLLPVMVRINCRATLPNRGLGQPLTDTCVASVVPPYYLSKRTEV